MVTDRGTPVARLLGVETAPLLEQLIEQGVLSKPKRPNRPVAQDLTRSRATESVSPFVAEQRR